ncbi:TIGR02757 family protein [Pinibacter soli]|uniref:TIGR02757 family protein n=1 Tax=Pinibacter soli TaxID=3044211 RepID=A0ABT6R840_9BACT|nr:TIGR02757 family protein [Pinibacter soli]MDI3318730.1 TIGR02757 family protein [Pinibacter soli]
MKSSKEQLSADDKKLVDFFNRKVGEYNAPAFIPDDPISIPHKFSKKQDIEIAGFFASILAWGNRKTIINSCTKLFNLMDNAPHQFVTSFEETDLIPFIDFVHRTFNATDLFHSLKFLQYHYKENTSLETAFSKWMQPDDENIENALNGFHHYFFDFDEFPERTRKHIAAPFKKSACKRLNMYLRWMVRNDNKKVDFGIWKKIKPSQLICPMDVHVARVAKRFNLLDRKQVDWQAAVELTAYLSKLDRNDPVKYDFALFGLGVIEKY